MRGEGEGCGVSANEYSCTQKPSLSVRSKPYFKGDVFTFSVLYSTLLHLPPSDSTVSEDAGIELRTVATTRLSDHSARSHP